MKMGILMNGSKMMICAGTLQQPQGAATCALGGAALCHSKAICVDYNPGFCCQCIDGYVGNGHNCLTDGEPYSLTLIKNVFERTSW